MSLALIMGMNNIWKEQYEASTPGLCSGRTPGLKGGGAGGSRAGPAPGLACHGLAALPHPLLPAAPGEPPNILQPVQVTQSPTRCGGHMHLHGLLPHTHSGLTAPSSQRPRSCKVAGNWLLLWK